MLGRNVIRTSYLPGGRFPSHSSVEVIRRRSHPRVRSRLSPAQGPSALEMMAQFATLVVTLERTLEVLFLAGMGSSGFCPPFSWTRALGGRRQGPALGRPFLTRGRLERSLWPLRPLLRPVPQPVSLSQPSNLRNISASEPLPRLFLPPRKPFRVDSDSSFQLPPPLGLVLSAGAGARRFVFLSFLHHKMGKMGRLMDKMKTQGYFRCLAGYSVPHE